MGTRNLICVFHKGAYRIAQYGQWDGYPSGQGAGVLQFLHSLDTEDKKNVFLAKLEASRFATDDDFNAINKRVDDEKIKNWKDVWPELSRDTGSDILQLVMDREPGIVLRDSLSFAADSLFCEWAYVIDFDKGTLEAFKGYNKQPLAEGERFYGLVAKEGGGEYQPVAFAAEFNLDTLPTVDEFIAKLEPSEESEED